MTCDWSVAAREHDDEVDVWLVRRRLFNRLGG
jgi:hypothetical protein